ncbi:MAG: hypothetical protein HY579_12455 [Nitrospinae bacterium]|nr:hypothetical protein [Nitrospinota bacterium]
MSIRAGSSSESPATSPDLRTKVIRMSEFSPSCLARTSKSDHFLAAMTSLTCGTINWARASDSAEARSYRIFSREKKPYPVRQARKTSRKAE